VSTQLHKKSPSKYFLVNLFTVNFLSTACMQYKCRFLRTCSNVLRKNYGRKWRSANKVSPNFHLSLFCYV
jgi:hypothetical protein